MIAFALLLLLLLALREIARISVGLRWRAVTQWLTAAVIPLFVIFLASVGWQLAQIFLQ